MYTTDDTGKPKGIEPVGLPPQWHERQTLLPVCESRRLGVFFSHWNELLNNGQPQRFEIALTTRDAKKVYVSLECTTAAPSEEVSEEYSKDVGCRFEGEDSYDITLGFYFI